MRAEPLPAERPPLDTAGVDDIRVRYTRSPSDALRLVVALVVLLVGVLLTTAAKQTIGGLERDILVLFDGLPGALDRFVVGVIQLVAIAGPLAAAITLVALRRWRTLGLAVLAMSTALALYSAIEQAVDRIHPAGHDAARRAGSWVADAAYPGSAYLAGIAAAVTVIAPSLPRVWRRWVWASVAVVALGRVVSGTGLAVDLVAALAAGWAVGLVVLLAFGVRDRHPAIAQVRDALALSGLTVVDLRPADVDARGSTPYFATLTDGTGAFVKVLSAEERSADLLFRLYRAIRLENVGDERPFSSLRRTVEHEALLSLRAGELGVRTPRFLGLARVVGDDAMALAYEAMEGRSLDAVDDAELTDDVLRDIWRQVAVLRTRRIAHRDLRLANVFLADDGRPWIIDFGFSELAVSDDVLASDVAELVMSTALKVGPGRAVAAAVDVLGAEAVGPAAARLQPLALSGATRSALHDRKGFDHEVRDEVARACRLGEVRDEKIERISPRSVVMFLFAGVATYVIVHQLSDVPDAVEQARNLDWAWVPAILSMSALTYVGAALSLAGSVPDRLPAGPTYLSQLSGSFMNRITPVKVGGLAVGIRFLEKAGVAPARAVTGEGLVALFGFVGHASLTIAFAFYAGSEGYGNIHLPSDHAILLGLAVALSLSGVVMLLPIGRHLAADRLVPALKSAVAGLAEVGRTPAKLFILISGGLIVTLSYLFCLWFSLEAFGGGERLAVVGVVYLTGSALAQAAPTPGGVGAVEAALIAGLTAVGVDKETAVPAVFLFRLATFWLPILPGWLSFHYLTRRNML